MTQEITGTLEDWSYDPFHHVVWGHIFGDSKNRFRDGTYIHTSSLNVNRQDAYELKQGEVIKTLNSSYRLGEPKDK